MVDMVLLSWATSAQGRLGLTGFAHDTRGARP